MDSFGPRTNKHRLGPWAAVLLASCTSLVGIEDPAPRPESDGGNAGIGGDEAAAGAAGSRSSGGEAGSDGEGGSGAVAVVGDGGEAGSGADGGSAGAGATDGGGGAGGTGVAPECQPEDVRCDIYQPQHCVDGHWADNGSICPLACVDGACQDPPSCLDDVSPPCVDGVSCCETIWVPGGTYTMGKHNELEPEWAFERSVSGFYLDRFEVTVGRMRAFTNDFMLPSEGEGAHPRLANSGWREAWEQLPHPDIDGKTLVPQNAEELIDQLSTQCREGQTWSENGAQLPANCVNWYVAFAFCAWDGGRLPTEAEWNYAAAYGAAARPYPWSVDESDFAISAVNAAYWDAVNPLLTSPMEVGTHPEGRGGFFRYSGRGHDDLAGNVMEWTLDAWSDSPLESCADCFEPWSDAVMDRVVRSGAYGSAYDQLLTGHRAQAPAELIDVIWGLRCARDMDTHPE